MIGKAHAGLGSVVGGHEFMPSNMSRRGGGLFNLEWGGRRWIIRATELDGIGAIVRLLP